MQLNQLKYSYFLGIGGIGMSALARYFNAVGICVSGYDKTPTALTQQLMAEGIDIHFEDLGEGIGEQVVNDSNTLVVWTPAIPASHKELVFFRQHNYPVMKRAEVLGMITKGLRGFAVAGTHGKTTTSTMLAHIFQQAHVEVNAFLGGISSNFHSNLVLHPNATQCIVEADEFDRSFLHLSPYAAVITSTDADHLDVYGEANELVIAFQAFADLIDQTGYLVVQKDISVAASCSQIPYGFVQEAPNHLGVYGMDLRVEQHRFCMNVVAFGSDIGRVELGVPGVHNAENALAVIAVAIKEGLSLDVIKLGLRSFKGVQRRFDVHVEKPNCVYIDDYAHHPTAIRLLIASVRMLYPKSKITAVFQPHLFSRTRDFLKEFAEELSAVDELIVLPIYPARELPIEGITSERIVNLSSAPSAKVMSPVQVLEKFQTFENGVLLTVGAGDIDRLVEPLKQQLQ
jgi:UDP-N-acetylmuramate--alanine ligase